MKLAHRESVNVSAGHCAAPDLPTLGCELVQGASIFTSMDDVMLAYSRVWMSLSMYLYCMGSKDSGCSKWW